ncbi:hypothetical protein OU489_000118 [Enterococcus hirae]|nr:hypothetical protein [Enterococcus hirae]
MPLSQVLKEHKLMKVSENSIHLWNRMLKIHGLSQTLAYLTTFNYETESIKNIINNLHLPAGTDKEQIETLLNVLGKTVVESGFSSDQELLTTIDQWNAMLKLNGADETFAFLATCNYNDSMIKFIIANLYLPETINPVIESDKIITAERSTITSDFQSNQELLNTIDQWNTRCKERGPNECLASLSKLNYKARSIKFIMANLQLPKTMDRLANTQKIVEANKMNIISNFNQKIKIIAKKKTLHSLNHIINNLELPKLDAEILRKKIILKTQKVIEIGVKKHLAKMNFAYKKTQTQVYIKQMQQEPNEIGIYLGKSHLKDLKRKAINSISNKHLSEPKKAKLSLQR